MNTTKTVSRKSAAKKVVDLALVFTIDGKSVRFAGQLDYKGKSKTFTGVADDKAMSTALKAAVAELKSKDVHLNVRHNHRNFQQWFFKTPGATQRL